MNKLYVLLVLTIFSTTISIASEPTKDDLSTKLDTLKKQQAQIEKEFAKSQSLQAQLKEKYAQNIGAIGVLMEIHSASAQPSPEPSPEV